MATITNTQVTTALADYVNWFGPHGSVTGVTNGVTEDDEDFTFDTDGGVEVTINYLELVDPVVAKQIIFAAVVDDLIGDISAGNYGPFTRETAITDLPFLDVNVPRVHYQTVNGNDLYFTYDQLANLTHRQDQVLFAEGWTGKVNALKTEIAAINTTAAAMTAPHTYADYKALITALKAIFETKAQI